MIDLRFERLERIRYAVSEMARMARENAVVEEAGTLEDVAAEDDVTEWELLLEEIDALISAKH